MPLGQQSIPVERAVGERVDHLRVVRLLRRFFSGQSADHAAHGRHRSRVDMLRMVRLAVLGKLFAPRYRLSLGVLGLVFEEPLLHVVLLLAEVVAGLLDLFLAVLPRELEGRLGDSGDRLQAVSIHSSLAVFWVLVHRPMLGLVFVYLGNALVVHESRVSLLAFASFEVVLDVVALLLELPC